MSELNNKQDAAQKLIDSSRNSMESLGSKLHEVECIMNGMVNFWNNYDNIKGLAPEYVVSGEPDKGLLMSRDMISTVCLNSIRSAFRIYGSYEQSLDTMKEMLKEILIGRNLQAIYKEGGVIETLDSYATHILIKDLRFNINLDFELKLPLSEIEEKKPVSKVGAGVDEIIHKTSNEVFIQCMTLKDALARHKGRTTQAQVELSANLLDMLCAIMLHWKALGTHLNFILLNI